MSTKVIGFPSNPSVDDEYQGWVWDGNKWVSDAVNGGLWEQNGDDIFYNDGNVSTTGTFTAGQVVLETATSPSGGGAVIKNSTGDSGVVITNNGIRFDPIVDDQMTLGDPQRRWKDGNFSGTVDAAGFTINGVPISGGGGFSGNNLVIENSGAPEDQRKWRFNVNQQSGRLRIQTLNDDDSLNISDLIRFERDGTIIATSTVTATDFIATSDERVKDNITTVPVGLIDSLKGREWEWKESGKKGSGVVAQELEQVLPHLVQEDAEGMKSVSYMGLCAYLIEELKDCRKRLDVLEGKS